MIRRSFRLGLVLGLLGGLAVALVKVVGGRSGAGSSAADPGEWPPLRVEPASAAPTVTSPAQPAAVVEAEPAPTDSPVEATAPAPEPDPAPVPPAAPALPTPLVADEAGAPVIEPVPSPAPAARKRAPRKAAPAAEKAAPADEVPAAAAKKQRAKQPAKKAAKKASKKAVATAWVVPEGDVCPTTHPVKARTASGIFHLPGMLNYLRTKPDRCYRDAQAAEADGLRAAKR